MSDGAMLAVELFLPAAAKRGASVPAILKLARFGRLEGGKISAEESAWLDHGYALVLADLRGTGASTGTSRYGRSELPDLRQLARWIASQPWSNGRIGAYGTSFQGTAAELLAATGEPSVAAVAPLFSDFEYYGDLVRPGGVLHAGLVTDLGAFMKAMDAGESARAVESDTGGAILRQALKDHAGNLDLAASARAAVFADDPVPGARRLARRYECRCHSVTDRPAPASPCSFTSPGSTPVRCAAPFSALPNCRMCSSFRSDLGATGEGILRIRSGAWRRPMRRASRPGGRPYSLSSTLA
jgi:putative CocE/NonD family hydrolase